jgi:hypothetical protein
MHRARTYERAEHGQNGLAGDDFERGEHRETDDNDAVENETMPRLHDNATP